MIVKIDGKYLVVKGFDVEAYDNLPVGVYRTIGGRMLSLERFADRFEEPEHIFGKSVRYRIEKVMKAWKESDRMMSVLFVGEKGTGKSMAARIIANRLEMPTVVVDQLTVDELKYLVTTLDNTVIIIDEFEKRYSSYSRDNEEYRQEDLLNLLDGSTTSNRNLIILTANYINKINDAYIGRPNRIRYVMTFNPLSVDDILEIFEYYDVKISKAEASLLATYEVNTDLVKHIALEVKRGINIIEAIEDTGIAGFISVDRLHSMIRGTFLYTYDSNGILVDVAEDVVKAKTEGDILIVYTEDNKYEFDLKQPVKENIKTHKGEMIEGKVIISADGNAYLRLNYDFIKMLKWFGI